MNPEPLNPGTRSWRPRGVEPERQLPLLALVGKGVCFDSGGLDIKSAAGGWGCHGWLVVSHGWPVVSHDRLMQKKGEVEALTSRL